MYTTVKRAVLFFALLGFCCGLFLYTQAQRQKIVIVPHHDFVASMRRGFLEQEFGENGRMGRGKGGREVEVVVVVSPNHFTKGRYDVVTTRDGARVVGMPADDEAFAYEHGVANVLPDVRALLPNARVVPVIVKEKAEKRALDVLAEHIERACRRARCVVVASVDFVHNETPEVAQEKDAVTMQLLVERSAELLTRATADSPETLYVVAELARAWQLDWHFFRRTHSGEMSKRSDAVDTVSHILGAYK